ncbi:hypothetical protein BDV93DRAFT_514915 [Ceratobasidium sp. AG-I]|nr:hypothetical protein BDV93DRAFT_514915 [Ceratobasidium sp. AG-I]
MTSESQNLAASSRPPTTRVQDRERRIDFDRVNYDDSIDERKSNISVQITFVALGVSSLLPWNSIITVLPFFLERLSGALHDSFASWLSFLFNGVGLVAMGLATWFGGRITGPPSFVISLSALTFLFAFLSIIPFLTLSPPAFFAIALVISALTAAAGGSLQTSTVTLAPRYGPGAIASYMAGSALSAVGVSALQLVTASTSTSIELPNMGSASWSATICFAVSAILLALTLVFYRAMVATNRKYEPFGDTKDICDSLPIFRCHQPHKLIEQKTRVRIMVTTSQFFILALLLWILTFMLYKCVFPAITASIEPTSPYTNPLIFNALHFLVFNTADLMGRASTSINSVSSTNGFFLVIYSLARALFVPFFLMCNVPGSSYYTITSDIAYMLGLFFLGLTHGHCSTLCLVAASEGKDSETGERASRLAQFWMMAGIVAGGGASFGVRALL